MPFAVCPNCGESFHLKVSENIEDWNKKFPVSNNGNRYIECFYCWKELKEYDVIEIIKVPEFKAEYISVGDKGTVLMIYSNNEYEIECVNPDGTTKWLETLPRNCLKYAYKSDNEKYS